MGSPSENRKRRWRGRYLVEAVVAVVALVVATVAWADTVTPDGDTVTAGNQGTVNLGTVAPGAVLTPQTSFLLTCTGKAHPDSGQTLNLTFSLAGSTVPAGSLSATSASIGAVPGSWPDDTTGGGSTNCSSITPETLNDNGNSTVSITAPTTPGTYDYVVRWDFGLSPAGSGDSQAVVGGNTTVTYRLTVPAPNLSINDVSQAEGNSGTSNFSFTVSLSSAAPTGGVTFDIATASNTATTADSDYVAKSLTGQTIPAGSSTYTFTVVGNGDTTFESNETFFVNVTNVTGANLSDAQGQGTIVNDDTSDIAPTVSSSVPANGATNVPIGDDLTVTFSEPVNVTGTWFTLVCNSVTQAATASGGPTTFTINPTANLPKGASCTLTVIKGQVSDQDGNDPPDNMTANFATGFGTQANRPPTVDAGGPYSVNEGSSVTVSASGDDLDGDALTYAWDLDNNGSYETAGQSVSFSAASLDGPSSHTIKVRATDTDSANGTATATVNVLNVAPTVAITGAPVSSLEGTAISLGANVSDPAPADTFAYAWSVTKNGSAYASGTASTFSFTPDDDGTYVVDLRVTDDDGGAGDAPGRTITATNVAPTGTLGNNGPKDEGSAVTVSFTGQSDPSSADTTAGFHYVFDCNDGDLSGATYASSGTSASTTCTFPDGPATPTVKARIIDKDDGYTEYTTVVTVNNAKPTVAPLSVSGNSGTACLAGNTVTLGFSWTDPAGSYDTHSYDVNWGDGSHTTASATSPVSGLTHTYLAGGPYIIVVTVNDEDPGTGGTKSSSSFSFLYNVTGVLQPVNDTQAKNDPSIFKYGSTIPVKIRVTDCGDHVVPDLTPQVGVQKVSGSTPPTGVDEAITSTSGADTGTTMRYSDGIYIYNLATKSLADNSATYRITITGPFAPVTTLFGTKAK